MPCSHNSLLFSLLVWEFKCWVGAQPGVSKQSHGGVGETAGGAPRGCTGEWEAQGKVIRQKDTNIYRLNQVAKNPVFHPWMSQCARVQRGDGFAFSQYITNFQMDLRNIPEEVVKETLEYKCLQSQFSLLYNESLGVKTQLDEARALLLTAKNAHLRQIEHMEVTH